MYTHHNELWDVPEAPFSDRQIWVVPDLMHTNVSSSLFMFKWNFSMYSCRYMRSFSRLHHILTAETAYPLNPKMPCVGGSEAENSFADDSESRCSSNEAQTFFFGFC